MTPLYRVKTGSTVTVCLEWTCTLVLPARIPEVTSVYTESIQSLAHRINQAQHSQPRRFIFFLGAGASESSGIPVASWMMRDFERNLQQLWAAEGQPAGSFEAWLETRPGWQTNSSRYAQYFEAYEPTEHGRARYLNRWMQTASPGWGVFLSRPSPR